jgi:hypothetical protein
MDAILTHARDASAIRTPTQEARDVARAFGRLLKAVAYAAANRLASPARDVQSDYYRFPPF